MGNLRRKKANESQFRLFQELAPLILTFGYIKYAPQCSAHSLLSQSFCPCYSVLLIQQKQRISVQMDKRSCSHGVQRHCCFVERWSCLGPGSETLCRTSSTHLWWRSTLSRPCTLRDPPHWSPISSRYSSPAVNWAYSHALLPVTPNYAR